MATNKMKLRHAYRMGGDNYVEEVYGVRLNKDEKNLHKQIESVIIEHEETLKALSDEEEQSPDTNVEEKMEFLESLDLEQLRSMAKSTINIPSKNIMKMKKEELIVELLK